MIKRGLLKEYAATISLIARAIDMLAVFVSALLSYYYKFNTFVLVEHFQVAVLLGVLLVPIIFPIFNVYRSWRGASQFQHIKLITLSWATIVFLLIVIATFLKATTMFSREWIIAWAVSGWLSLIIFRLVLNLVLKSLRSSGWNSRKVLVAGANPVSKVLIERVQQASWSGLDIFGYVDDIKAVGENIDGVNVIGRLSDVHEIANSQKVDEVWVVLPITRKDSVMEILEELQFSTADVRYFLDMEDFRLMNHSISEIMGMPVVNLTETPMEGFNRFVKALEDRLLALLIIILVSPLAVIISIAIKVTSPGPVLFKQMRHGWDGRKIKVYKFRTMYVHKEKSGGVTQASREDNRITPIGRFLRRTSLDEIPQFFNVLQGRMSIVGPRPHAIEHNELYKDQIHAYMLRHKVKPGITGWAQINGWRGETDTLEKMKKRVEFDIYYIENWSLWFDLKIMSMTLIKGFVNKNAY